MRFEEAYRMAQRLATLNCEPYVVSIKRSFVRVRWCAEPQWLYESVQELRRSAMFVYADSPPEASQSVALLQQQSERS